MALEAPVSEIAAETAASSSTALGAEGRVGFDQLDLRFFLGGQLLTATLPEHVGRLPALLQERVHDLDLGSLVERLHGIDLVLLESGLDHPDGAEAGLVLGLHGFNHVFLNSIE